MQQCANDHALTFPLGANTVLKQFYMDDCLAGSETEEELLALCQETKTVLALGGFQLVKWRSNSFRVQREIELLPAEEEVIVGPAIETSVLGLNWNVSTDELAFVVKSLSASKEWTKRSVLSITARLYDPNGWIAPFIIKTKILLQKIWKSKVDWDEMLPADIKENWLEIFEQIPLLKNLRLPRWLGYSSRNLIHLHGFADASCQAYGAVIYLVAIGEREVTSKLLIAKSRVAPIQSQSIPRLELCAAVMLSDLMKRMRDNLREELHCTEIAYTCWTDSMVVLGWLGHETGTLKQYVASRISTIQ